MTHRLYIDDAKLHDARVLAVIHRESALTKHDPEYVPDIEGYSASDEQEVVDTTALIRSNIPNNQDLTRAHRIVKLTCNNSVVGFAEISKGGPKIGVVSELAVSPLHRGKQFGAVLLGFAFSYFGDQHRARIFISDQDEPSFGFFVRHGFEVTSKSRGEITLTRPAQKLPSYSNRDIYESYMIRRGLVGVPKNLRYGRAQSIIKLARKKAGTPT